MSRALTPEYSNRVGQGTVRPVFFVQVDFTGGPTRWNSGTADEQWNGSTWIAVGSFGEISPVRETTDIRAEGLTLTLGGIDTGILALVLAEITAATVATVWLGLYDENGVLIADENGYAGESPYEIFHGTVDSPEVMDDGETATIKLNVENELLTLLRTRERRYTDQDQQAQYPGDLGMQYVTDAGGEANRADWVLLGRGRGWIESNEIGD